MLEGCKSSCPKDISLPPGAALECPIRLLRIAVAIGKPQMSLHQNLIIHRNQRGFIQTPSNILCGKRITYTRFQNQIPSETLLALQSPLGIPSKAEHLIVHTLPKVVCISSPHPEYLIIHYHYYGKFELLSRLSSGVSCHYTSPLASATYDLGTPSLRSRRAVTGRHDGGNKAARLTIVPRRISLNWEP